MPTVTKSMKIAAAGGVAAIAAGIAPARPWRTPRPPHRVAPPLPHRPSPVRTQAREREAEEVRAATGRARRNGRSRSRHELGLTEAKVSAALEKVRAVQQPTTPPAEGSKPTDAERQAREKARVTAPPRSSASPRPRSRLRSTRSTPTGRPVARVRCPVALTRPSRRPPCPPPTRRRCSRHSTPASWVADAPSAARAAERPSARRPCARTRPGDSS